MMIYIPVKTQSHCGKCCFDKPLLPAHYSDCIYSEDSLWFQYLQLQVKIKWHKIYHLYMQKSFHNSEIILCHIILSLKRIKPEITVELSFWIRISLCNPDWPGTHSSFSCLSLRNAEIIELSHHGWPRQILFSFFKFMTTNFKVH